MASEEEVVRFIFSGANEMAEIMYQLIRWALERRDKGRDEVNRDPSRISGRIAPDDAASFAADLAAAGIAVDYVPQPDGGFVYSCDAKHFEHLKALTKGYAAKYDAMHPDSVDNVYYETLRDWRGCSFNECFEVASSVEVSAVNKMRADLAAMGVYFEVARRPDDLGYVVKFNAKDASLVERALCELDQAYGHPRNAQDVKRAIAGYLPAPSQGRWEKVSENRASFEAPVGEAVLKGGIRPENGSYHAHVEIDGEEVGDATFNSRRGAAAYVERCAIQAASERGTNLSIAVDPAPDPKDKRVEGDYTLRMSTVEWDREARIMTDPMTEDGIPFRVEFDAASGTADFTFPSSRAGEVKAIADRYIRSDKESLQDFGEWRFANWDEFSQVAETGLIKDPSNSHIKAEWIDVGDGMYSLEAYANPWDEEGVVGVSVSTKASFYSDPALEGWEVWGNADGPNFGAQSFDDLAAAMDYAEHLADDALGARGYDDVELGPRPPEPSHEPHSQERAEAAVDLAHEAADLADGGPQNLDGAVGRDGNPLQLVRWYDEVGEAHEQILDTWDAARNLTNELAGEGLSPFWRPLDRQEPLALEWKASQERTVEQADHVVVPHADGPSETVETVITATKSTDVQEAGERIGSSLGEMTNPDGLDLPSIEQFGSAEKLDGAKIGDVLKACSQDVQMIKAQIAQQRQQGVERGAKAAAQAKGGAVR